MNYNILIEEKINEVLSKVSSEDKKNLKSVDNKLGLKDEREVIKK
ncbi:hypothetical protein [Clostridium perfringens]|nr:hypothetical protein [Clostridium perfringens]